jgi:hypothetical protein
MSFWTAVVVLAAIWACVTLYSRRHDHHLGVTRDEDGNPIFAPRSDDEVKRELEQLRERVKVLERIAIDEARPQSLAHEIERLRDKE